MSVHSFTHQVPVSPVYAHRTLRRLRTLKTPHPPSIKGSSHDRRHGNRQTDPPPPPPTERERGRERKKVRKEGRKKKKKKNNNENNTSSSIIIIIIIIINNNNNDNNNVTARAWWKRRILAAAKGRRRRRTNEEAVDEHLWKDDKGPSSVRPGLGTVIGQTSETGWSTYGPSRAPSYHNNRTELNKWTLGWNKRMEQWWPNN